LSYDGKRKTAVITSVIIPIDDRLTISERKKLIRFSNMQVNSIVLFENNEFVVKIT